MNNNTIIVFITMLFNITNVCMEAPLDNNIKNKQNILKSFNFNNNKDVEQIICKFILNRKQWWYLDTTFSHPKAVTALCFNNDNSLLATGSKNNKAYIFDIETKKETHSFSHDARVNSVHFNNTGTQLATGSDDYTARIFTINNKSDNVLYLQQDRKVGSVCFNPTGELLGIGEKGYKGYIFNIELKHKRVCGSKQIIKSVTFDPTGTFFAITTHGDMRIININTNYDIILNNFDKNANFCCFDPHGKRLAIAIPLYQVKIFNMTTKNEITCIQHEHSVSTVFFDNTGEHLITRAVDNVIRVFNIQTKQVVASFSPTSTILAMCVSLTKNLIAIGTNVDNKAYIFALQTNPTLEQLLLRQAFNTWLLIEKPPKNIITTIEKLLADIALKLQLFEDELNAIWLTFPTRMRDALWRSIEHKIKKYGKKVENCTVS